MGAGGIIRSWKTIELQSVRKDAFTLFFGKAMPIVGDKDQMEPL
jgi:predicted lipid carrier protein YhbT